jgi:hypothetical protein
LGMNTACRAFIGLFAFDSPALDILERIGTQREIACRKRARCQRLAPITGSYPCSLGGGAIAPESPAAAIAGKKAQTCPLWK